jgi:hypothetical protein
MGNVSLNKNGCYTLEYESYFSVYYQHAFMGLYWANYSPDASRVFVFFNYHNPQFDEEKQYHRLPTWITMA